MAGAVLAAVADVDDEDARRVRLGKPLLVDLGNHAGNSCSLTFSDTRGGMHELNRSRIRFMPRGVFGSDVPHSAGAPRPPWNGGGDGRGAAPLRKQAGSTPVKA
ncbi:hypothetical protein GCM10010478_31520 [Streptomyces erythrogriseus]|uniref:Uncharacterized protein n=2 Tax=Streptomyces TaxID=1883 RepID=A0ABN3WVG7_9ACTN